MARAFKINPADNVATMLDDATDGRVQVLGQDGLSVSLREALKLGHKIAICDIPTGQPVVKFGVPIGRASRDIQAGQWVHLHNLTSEFDARSQTLDLHTGAATDTKYE
jgi:altronate dehydratase small subunit